MFGAPEAAEAPHEIGHVGLEPHGEGIDLPYDDGGGVQKSGSLSMAPLGANQGHTGFDTPRDDGTRFAGTLMVDHGDAPNGSAILMDGSRMKYSMTPEDRISEDFSGIGNETETGSSGRPGRNGKRQKVMLGHSDGKRIDKKCGQNMKGRFSGRLPTKQDEKRLADECQHLGQYLSEDGSLCTLPTIIRAIARGDVRLHLEKMDAQRREYIDKVLLLEQSMSGTSAGALANNVALLQSQLDQARNYSQYLEKQLGELRRKIHDDPVLAEKIDMLGLPPKPVPGDHGFVSIPQAANPRLCGSVMIQNNAYPTLHKTSSANVLQGSMQTSINKANSVPIPDAAKMPLLHHASSSVALNSGPVMQTWDTQPSQSLHHSKSALSLHQQEYQQSAFGNVQQNATNSSLALRDEHQSEVTGGSAEKETSQLTGHAQQLVRAASLHGVAKTEAASKAQQLAVEAHKHAQASVKAAQQAEELKKAIVANPDSSEAQDASKTVTSLEEQAQVHASITTQVVAKARDMHEKAQTHEHEEIKAITQANAIQARVSSWQQSSSHDGSIQPSGTGNISASVGITPGDNSEINEIMRGASLPLGNLPQPTLFVPTGGPTVATPTLITGHQILSSDFSAADVNHENASDGLPNQSVAISMNDGSIVPTNLSEEQQQHIAIAQMVLRQKGQGQVVNPSHMVYTHAYDPSAEATALQQQIAALHAQQPSHLVAAPPIYVADPGTALTNGAETAYKPHEEQVTLSTEHHKHDATISLQPLHLDKSDMKTGEKEVENALPSSQLIMENEEAAKQTTTMSPVISLPDFEQQDEQQ